MSSDAYAQVWDDDRIRSQKEMLVMLVMADMSGGDGITNICSASMGEIAKKCRMAEPIVKREIERLMSRGLLRITGAKDGSPAGFEIVRKECK
jgi:hypothetical protein